MHFMPNFFKEMPKSEKGQFRIYTGIFFIRLTHKEYGSRIYHNKRTAYFAVRLKALLRDIKTLGSECGVAWAIESIE